MNLPPDLFKNSPKKKQLLNFLSDFKMRSFDEIQAVTSTFELNVSINSINKKILPFGYKIEVQVHPFPVRKIWVLIETKAGGRNNVEVI